MIHLSKNQLYIPIKLFEDIEDSMVKACLQGYMGNAYVDKLENPSVALIVSGEYSFIGGDSKSKNSKKLCENIFNYILGDEAVVIYSNKNSGWKQLLLSVGINSPMEVIRYGIVQKDYKFDKEKLVELTNSVGNEYKLIKFDSNTFEESLKNNWSKEFCETFDSSEDYEKRGFGFGIIHNNELVSGASTMTVYDGGVEIQVATREDHRKKGLSMACSAALILECDSKGLRPCWDAANTISRDMAIKLGYEYSGEYSTIHIKKPE